MKSSIIINGQFTARRVTGQERFALEIILELDKICKKGQYSLVVPKNASNIPYLNNIPVIKFGKAKGSLWEQTFFCFVYDNSSKKHIVESSYNYACF